MIFNKGRAKGMEDIFGGPSDVGMNLGMGPGVIGGPENGFGNRSGPASFNGAGFDAGRPSFEEKFRETNSNYNNSDQRERGESFKKRDSFESKFAERPDFGDRFTANRNKTHPSNRGGRGDVRQGTELRRSPGYESRQGQGNGFGGHERDIPPRFSGGREREGVNATEAFSQLHDAEAEDSIQPAQECHGQVGWSEPCAW